MVSQFYQLDRLVVEGGSSVCFPACILGAGLCAEHDRVSKWGRGAISYDRRSRGEFCLPQCFHGLTLTQNIDGPRIVYIFHPRLCYYTKHVSTIIWLGPTCLNYKWPNQSCYQLQVRSR
jgi:hypothetical protein